MKQDIWQTIADLTEEYNQLGLKDVIDYEKFYLYSIIAHSTQIEGSTLTEMDTKFLLDEGVTAKDKPFVFHQMNLDLHNAYVKAIQMAKGQEPITPEFLKKLNSYVMEHTGSIHNGMAGTWNEANGDFRLHNVSAGFGGRSYVSYQKVVPMVEELCTELNQRLKQLNAVSLKDMYTLSFDAHYNLVTIHPFSDGNGRTSRLLMNHIQFSLGLIPTKIRAKNKKEYIQALEACREKDTLEPIREFLTCEHQTILQEEIMNYKRGQEKSNGFFIVF